MEDKETPDERVIQGSEVVRSPGNVDTEQGSEVVTGDLATETVEENWDSSDVQDATRVIKPNMAYENDQKFFRNVGHYLGVSLFISLAIVGVLAALKIEVPQMLVAVASGILGIFGAMFGIRGK